MFACTKPSSGGFRTKSSVSRTRLVPSTSPDMDAPSELEGRLGFVRTRLRRAGGRDVFEPCPFLCELVVDERLVVEPLVRSDLEQAVGKFLRVCSAWTHLSDE